MKVRDPYFDVVKAIAIFMVIFFHVRWLAPEDMFPIYTNNFRVGMNMPVFFVLSGYFAWPTIEAHDWRKLMRTIRNWYCPALFAGVLYTLLGLIFGISSSSSGDVAIRLARSLFVDPWFITTLAECYFLLFVSVAIGKRMRKGLLIVGACLVVTMCLPLFMPEKIHYGCLTSMMPHFCFGIVLRKFGVRLWEKKRVGLLCFMAFVCFTLVEGDVVTNGMSFYTADSTIRAFTSVRSSICFLLRPTIGLLGAIGVMSVIRIALDVAPFLSHISVIGRLTLGIYIFHLWPLERLRGIVWIGGSRMSVLLTSLAMLSIFSMVTWLLMEKTGRFRKWIWGK